MAKKRWGVIRWIFRRPKNYTKPTYSPYQRRSTLNKFRDSPDSGYKVSRVNVPKSRQDSLFSAMVNWLIKVGLGNRNNRGGRG